MRPVGSPPNLCTFVVVAAACPPRASASSPCVSATTPPPAAMAAAQASAILVLPPRMRRRWYRRPAVIRAAPWYERSGDATTPAPDPGRGARRLRGEERPTRPAAGHPGRRARRLHHRRLARVGSRRRGPAG